MSTPTCDNRAAISLAGNPASMSSACPPARSRVALPLEDEPRTMSSITKKVLRQARESHGAISPFWRGKENASAARGELRAPQVRAPPRGERWGGLDEL